MVEKQTHKNRKEKFMDNNEILATEVDEKVEGITTEEIATEQNESAKVYTEEEFNKKLDEVIGKKLARNTAKIRKEYEKKYGELETVLKVGTGKDDLTEVTDTFKKFYESKGIQIPQKPTYSDKDIEVLARAEADDIIKLGLDEVVDEVDRLADIGLGNMSAREKAVFKTLAEYRQNAEQSKALSKIGVTEDVYTSKEFKDFASKFNNNTSIVDIYDIYTKTQPHKEVKTMGSMRNTTPKETGVKDFYTRDEALQFTKKDFDKNPALYKAVEQSMLRW